MVSTSAHAKSCLPLDTKDIDDRKWRASVKRKADEDPTERPNKIVRHEMPSTVDNKAVRAMKLVAYRQKRRHVQKLPKTRTETLHVLGSQAIDPELLCAIDNGNERERDSCEQTAVGIHMRYT